MSGYVAKISGPVVTAKGLEQVTMYEVVKVGKAGLFGEVIKLNEDEATVQVYEDTAGVSLGEPVTATSQPLAVTLGPGLLGNIFDGIQRPLPLIWEDFGNFIAKGITTQLTSENKSFAFTPVTQVGSFVQGGDIIGSVLETAHFEHKIMVPPDAKGKVVWLASGTVKINQPVAKLDNGQNLYLHHSWPVRQPRPFKEKLSPKRPLWTGQRVIDFLFPIPKGGIAIIPGGFGTGKTVTEQTIAKWADADIIVYVGCGERGNEMTEVLVEFPQLKDPRKDASLMERTVLIANTSNMPVAAREASIYTGITIAEYFRDMGYDVCLLADSTSRWAEALREVSGRLEEMPGEEGYPAYLATRLANFYERAGQVVTLSQKEQVGSVTVVGAVSPPGGDFSEPMTQNSLRVTGAFWALDTDLAHRRHFPAINWLKSYTLYFEALNRYYQEQGLEIANLRQELMQILQQEAELQEIVKLVGPDALPEEQKLLLKVAKVIREDFLQQSAYSTVDAFCPLEKQLTLAETIVYLYKQAQELLKQGISCNDVFTSSVKSKVAALKETLPDQLEQKIAELKSELNKLALALKEA